jgi:very-short-patch-repair endonuclease
MKAERKNYYLYNKGLQPNANQLRKSMTKAEACLWKYVLRAGGLKGYSFRRQRPVMDYIADFLCKELSLIIEVDGITHSWEGAIDKDRERQLALERAGFTVLRVSDEEVLHGINGVKEKLERWVEEFEGCTPPPPPASGGHSFE